VLWTQRSPEFGGEDATAVAAVVAVQEVSEGIGAFVIAGVGPVGGPNALPGARRHRIDSINCESSTQVWMVLSMPILDLGTVFEASNAA
jgi:hypothetical protein